MSKLSELIAKLCPDGVEYKRLGDIATISRGGSFQKKDFRDTGIPCIHYGQIYTTYNLFVNETLKFIDEKDAGKAKFAWPDDIVMAVTSENIEDVCKCVAWFGNERLAVSGHTAIIHHNQDSKYLVYWFHSNMFFSQKKKLAHGTKVIEVTPDSLSKIKIPVPPLEVQREIVRILDTFAETTEELAEKLNAELIARRKQYEYYRDLLLTFDDAECPRGGDTHSRSAKRAVRWAKLGDIAKFSYGYTTKSTDAGEVRYLRITDISEDGTLQARNRKYIDLNEENKSFLLKKGELVMARTGATFGKTLYYESDAPAIYASFLIKISLDSNILLSRYYWHFSNSSLYWQQANKLVSKGGQQQFNTGAISKIQIPVPPLSEQRRIVSILDRFDALCHDITAGLPAEIAARRKQYEYYRDKLLTFEEKTA